MKKEYIFLFIVIILLFIYLGFQYSKTSGDNLIKGIDDSQIEFVGELVVMMNITSRDPGGAKGEQAAFILFNDNKYQLDFDKKSEFVNVESISIFESGNKIKVKGTMNDDSILVRYMEYLK